MAITDLPDAPQRSDTPDVFVAKADAFIAALPQFVTEANDLAAAMNLNSTTDTSATSNSIGTGAKTFTVSAGKSFQPGMYLVIADTAAPSTNSMSVQVTSYSGTTLIVNSLAFSGSGTKAAWTISQSVGLVPQDNSVSHDKLATSLRKSLSTIQDFRLTLTSGLPVTTADVTGATTIYASPYSGNSIALHDGTNWNLRTSAEFSLALGTLTSGRPYDVFCYDNSGVPTLEFLAWTNDTTRATALTYQDGILVKSGAVTRRYLGTFYTTSTTQTEDSKANRYLWNYYHRAIRPLLVSDPATSWTYTTATYRQANGNAANKLNFVIGVQEDAVKAQVNAMVSPGSSNANAFAGIGVNSTTTPSGLSGGEVTSGVAGFYGCALATYIGFPGLGRSYLAWLEFSTAAGTTTWNGTSSTITSGIAGEILG
jgi:hypothetical protein